MDFKIHSKFKPTGDQPQAIDKLSEGVKKGLEHQVLQGVTGSGKTFTMANIIERVQKPTLVLAHNKTLAYQLATEFMEFFPENAVEYFVSFYDYYQPEAYVAATDTYIAKDSSINDELDKLRHSATSALFERKDVIIVSSVSCIYSLGDPYDYENLSVSLRPGMVKDRDDIMRGLTDIQYQRNDISFERGSFRARGDSLDIFPASSNENAIRVEFFGDEIDRISEINALTGEIISHRNHVIIFPATHYASSPEKTKKAVLEIEKDLDQRLKELKDQNKLVEAQRLEERTRYDIEMLNEMGYCSGIENYTRYISQRPEGSRPFTLLDYFPEDFLVFVDESHVTLPQVHGMYEGNRSRKQNLVDFGFRLPSALDNRPLTFDEFQEITPQKIYVSATPGSYEMEHQENYVEQVIRPTGLLDPKIEVRPTAHQIDDLIGEIDETVKNGERVLITTLTKKMAEDLTHYFEELGIRVTYMHSDVDTIERMEIIRDLRLGKYDVLVGINLLREGLDLPEVSLIAILDADKEGFLRSETSLIQTIGRAARNVDGRVIMYGDNITGSMKKAIDETRRRRRIQDDYNKEHHIEPKTIVKGVRDILEGTKIAESQVEYIPESSDKEEFTLKDIKDLLIEMESSMKEAAENLEFERAADIRDEIEKIKKQFDLEVINES